MEIINKTHKGYKENDKRGTQASMTFGNNGAFIYFTIGCLKHGFRQGLRIHFACDYDRMYLFINNDPAGISLCQSGKDRGLRAKSRTLILALQDQYPHKIKTGAKFYLKESMTKINGSLTVEVLLHKKIKL